MLHLADALIQSNIHLQGFSYSPWSSVGLGALLKGISAIGRVGFEPATVRSQDQLPNH